MKHRSRWIAGLAAIALILVTAVTALAYSGQVPGSISISASASCTATSTATATVLDAEGAPVADVAVAWALVQTQSASDTVNSPSITNAQGVATTTLTLAAVNGPRTIRATVGAGTEAEVSASAVLNPVCGEVLPNTSTVGETGSGGTAVLVAALAFVAGMAALAVRRLVPTSR